MISENYDDEQDDGFVEKPFCIPEEEYEVGFLRREEKWLFGRMKIFLCFEILTSGDYHGEELYKPYNKPKKGKNGRIPTSSTYYRDCLWVAQGKSIRWDRSNCDLFRGKRFLVKVRTVTTDYRGKPQPEIYHYSIIDCLIKLLTDSENQ